MSLFIRLQQTGIDAISAAEFEHLGQFALQRSGRSPSPAFSEPATEFDLRFGKAGILHLASDWSSDEPIDRDGVTLQEELWADIAGAAIRSGHTAYWEIDAPEFLGGGRAAYTGVLHGTAGIGLAVLGMHARLSDRQPYVDLPDHPGN
jgi:hypothetical protein